MKRLALIVLLAVTLLGAFGIIVADRLAWYTPARVRHIAYSDAEKEKFSEGASAARDSAIRFLPLICSSLIVLTIVSFRRV